VATLATKVAPSCSNAESRTTPPPPRLRLLLLLLRGRMTPLLSLQEPMQDRARKASLAEELAARKRNTPPPALHPHPILQSESLRCLVLIHHYHRRLPPLRHTRGPPTCHLLTQPQPHHHHHHPSATWLFLCLPALLLLPILRLIQRLLLLIIITLRWNSISFAVPAPVTTRLLVINRSMVV